MALAAVRRWLVPALELCIIAFWVVLLGQEYLILSPRVLPVGQEFSFSVRTHHLWNDLEFCWDCALWNGYQRGGHPAFAEPFGSMLHPIVMVATQLWGVINGAKIALLAALWFAGFGQWWSARILKLGFLPRMWSALLIVTGGHLAGRMELGVFGLVLSTSMAGLVFSALLSLALRGGRRQIVYLALAAGSALLSGYGYMQFGLLVSLPALGFLLVDRSLQFRPLWRRFALAGVLAILIASPLLVPLAHFLPNFSVGWDPAFSSAQPLAYLPLNLVISDPAFLGTAMLGQVASPYLYSLFIGWTPVALAVLGLTLSRREDRGWVLYLVGVIGIIFLLASGTLLRWGQPLLPALAALRNPPLFAGLAVSPILTLAAYGLHRLLRRPWPALRLHLAAGSARKIRVFSLAWLLVIPLALNLRSAFQYARFWLGTEPMRGSVHQLLRGLETESLQWVQPPFGWHNYVEPAIARGMKLSPGESPWIWRGRETPRPVLEANGTRRPEEAIEQVDEIEGIPIYRLAVPPYAYVDHGNGMSTCRAQGRGGNLIVSCTTERRGLLIVQENMWTGWRAWLDGTPVPLVDDRRLSVSAPAGEHRFRFRYWPWDVPLGAGLSLLALAWCGWLWLRPAARRRVAG